MSAYKPEFKGPVEGWVVNYVTANYWRVERTHERADLIQDAYLVFRRVADRYPGVEARHFMALFKTSWTRHFTDLANADTATRAETHRAEGSADTDIGETGNAGPLLVAIRQAPAEVRAVLSLFLSAPEEILELALAGWKENDTRSRAGASGRINRLLGLPEGEDVLARVEDYFRPG